MIIQYMINKNNGKLYKAVNNSVLLMWYESLMEWRKCCTQYSDLFIDDYIFNFRMIEENKVELHK